MKALGLALVVFFMGNHPCQGRVLHPPPPPEANSSWNVAPSPPSQGLEYIGSPCFRPYLLIAAVGDNSALGAPAWLDDSPGRSFDMLAMYYGNDTAFSCPSCVGTFRHPGAKWKLLHLLASRPEWDRVMQPYQAFMVTDDDLLMAPHDLDIGFDVFSRHFLDLGQLSVCPSPDSYTWWELMYQNSSNTLRYTAFVENMAPMFSKSMLTKHVLPHLEDASIGWGLDFLWPFLLRYARESVGVVDAVCMTHPSTKPESGSSIYATTHEKGWTPRQERDKLMKHWKINTAAYRRHGLKLAPMQTQFAAVPLPPAGYVLPPSSYCPTPIAPWRPEAGVVSLASARWVRNGIRVVLLCSVASCSAAWYRRRCSRTKRASIAPP